MSKQPPAVQEILAAGLVAQNNPTQSAAFHKMPLKFESQYNLVPMEALPTPSAQASWGKCITAQNETFSNLLDQFRGAKQNITDSRRSTPLAKREDEAALKNKIRDAANKSALVTENSLKHFADYHNAQLPQFPSSKSPDVITEMKRSECRNALRQIADPLLLHNVITKAGNKGGNIEVIHSLAGDPSPHPLVNPAQLENLKQRYMDNNISGEHAQALKDIAAAGQLLHSNKMAVFSFLGLHPSIADTREGEEAAKTAPQPDDGSLAKSIADSGVAAIK